MSFLGRAAPIIAGPSGAKQGPVPPCAACRSDTVTRVPAVLGTEGAVLCLDAAECCGRYRGGVSPASYGAALRGELLAVAP